MAYKFLLLTFVWIGAIGELQAVEKRIEEGMVRSTEDVILDSDSIYQVLITQVRARACGNKLDLYEGEILHAFKGEVEVNAKFEFCGYAGLITYGAYVIGLNLDEATNKYVFMPDAIFFSPYPGRYFRKLSCESHEYVINGRKAIVLGFEEPKLMELLNKDSNP